MLKLDHHVRLDAKTVNAPNITSAFSERDLTSISATVIDGYMSDRQSRSRWEDRMGAAMDMAMQIVKPKTKPWPGCANVTFPLLTIASMQFHSRAYPALLPGPNIIKYKTPLETMIPEIAERNALIGSYMSWQLMTQDVDWEPQQDQALLALPIIGTLFKKSRWDRHKGFVISELVLPSKLVVDYWAKSIESARRKTHEMPMHRNEIYENVMSGKFRNVLNEEWFHIPPAIDVDKPEWERQQRQGKELPEPDETTPFINLEQCVWLDFDGDGYAEPWVITVEKSSGAVLRIVSGTEEGMIQRNEKGKILKINSLEAYTKYGFIPSPDGGIMDIGFGNLIGPINEQANSAINQLFDAGSAETAGGGFLGRGAKIRGGEYALEPGKYIRVDSTGDDLRKNIVERPKVTPSETLFKLLVLLIDYSNRVTSSTDIMVGENIGQNTPASTADTMVGEGQRIFGALFKRVWRCMKNEAQKVYVMNGMYMPEFVMLGTKKIPREWFTLSSQEVIPVCDPAMYSEERKQKRAIAIKAGSAGVAGYDRDEVEKDYLRGVGCDEDTIKRVFPGSKVTGPLPNPKVQMKEIDAQIKDKAIAAKTKEKLLELLSQKDLVAAQIRKLDAEAVQIMANIQGDADTRRLQEIELQLEHAHHTDEMQNKLIELLMKGVTDAGKQGNEQAGMGGLAKPPGNSKIPGLSADASAGGDGGLGGGSLLQ